MATDTEWPSEDEDFDAIVDSKIPQTAGNPERKSVSVISEDDAADESTITPETAPSPANVANQEESPSEEEAAVPEEPTAASEPPQQSEPASEAPAPNPIPAPTSPNPSKAPAGRLVIEILLLLALLGTAFWGFTASAKNKDLSADNVSLKKQVTQLNANPQIAIQKQTADLISKVGALMQLPAGETPTVANVSDAAAAKKQSAFFNNAQNGDKVLMYVKAGEAILYRPSTNKIVLVAPLSFSGTPATTAPATKTTR